MSVAHAAGSAHPFHSRTEQTLQRQSSSGVHLGRNVLSLIGRWLSALHVRGGGWSLQGWELGEDKKEETHSRGVPGFVKLLKASFHDVLPRCHFECRPIPQFCAPNVQQLV